MQVQGGDPAVDVPRPRSAARRRHSVVLAVVAAFIVAAVATAVGLLIGSWQAAESSPAEEPTESSAALYDRPADVDVVITSVATRTYTVECGKSMLGTLVAVDTQPLTGTAGTVFVTNHHVVKRCINRKTQVRVTSDLGSYLGDITRWDAVRDLALVDVPDLNVMGLVPQESVSVGEWVMAVGSPFGLDDFVTFGHVGKVDEIGRMIYSTAGIGPGNSGGPLTNGSGEVLGFNSLAWEEAPHLTGSASIKALCAVVLTCS